MGFIETVQSIDFTAVGTTNVLPLDIRDAVVKEKLSVMLFAEYFSKDTERPVLKYSEFIHPTDMPHPKHPNKTVPRYLTVTEGSKCYSASIETPPFFKFEEVPSLKKGKFKYDYDPPVCVSFKPGAKPEDFSVFDFTRKFESYPDSDRIKELLNLFRIGGHPYDLFKLGAAFRPQQFSDTLPTRPNADIKAFDDFQRDLEDWFKAGFPRRYHLFDRFSTKPFGAGEVYVPGEEFEQKDDGMIFLPPPIFYKPIGPMSYSFQEENTLQEVRFHRLFINPEGCGLREALIPSIFIQSSIGFNGTIMTGLPSMDRLPLWNVQRVMLPATDTVVLCDCIQDAEALQRKNEKNHNVAFTSFVDVGDNLELIDFSPLNRKNIVFLISNHNGKSLADAYENVAALFEFIRESKIRIRDVLFKQREVDYPDKEPVSSPEKLASIYYHSPPNIVPKSILPHMDGTEFYTMLTKIRKEREAPPFWATPIEEKPVKKNPADGILIRSLLYRNAITVLAGPPEAGKSRFCRSLIRYLVKGNDRQYMKERFWTRCCAGSTMKILYWNYDCIPNMEAWREICLQGIDDELKQDIFIEDAPTVLDGFRGKYFGRPDIEEYRKRLEKYTYKGTPGHPLDLLIVDTLSCVWNKDNIEASLQFLAAIMKAIPGMAVLAIHHTTTLGKPLGGGDALRIPRIVLTMEKADWTAAHGPSNTEDLYKFKYNKFSPSHASIESLPFYCIRENEDLYSVYDPVCTRDEMFSSLVYHYRERDDGHPVNKVIGAILRYSGREVQNRMIGEKKYLSILEKAKKKAPVYDEPPPKRGKRSKK